MAITASQAQGLVLALFGASAGGHLTGLTSGASLSGVAADLVTASGLVLDKDLSSNTAFRDLVLTTNLKLTGTALTEAQKWMDGEFTKGTARADILAAAVTFLDGLTDTTNAFYATAAAYRTTVANAVTWSQGAGATVYGVTALMAQQGTAGSGQGQTFTLTTGADTFVGTAGNDTITGTIAASGGTYSDTKDIVADGSSTDSDALNLTSTVAASVLGSVSGIEKINVEFNTLGATTLDAAKATNGAITVSQIKAGSTGDITINNAVGGTNATLGAGVLTGTVNYSVSGTTQAGSAGAKVDGGAATTVTVSGLDDKGATVTVAATATLNVTGAGHTNTSTTKPTMP